MSIAQKPYKFLHQKTTIDRNTTPYWKRRNKNSVVLVYRRLPEISKILIREACFADSPSLFLLLLCFEPHFRNITGRSEWIRSTNCCKTVQGVISNHVPATYSTFEMFHHDELNLFSPNSRKNCKTRFQVQMSKPDTTRSQEKNTGERETTGRWNLVICWFFVGFCGIGLRLGFYSCRTNTRDNSQLFFPQFSWMGKSVSLLDGKECFTLGWERVFHSAKLMKISFLGTYVALSPIIMVQGKMARYLRVNRNYY